jgi:hypothetical protein
MLFCGIARHLTGDENDYLPSSSLSLCSPCLAEKRSLPYFFSEVGRQTYLKGRKSQIFKFLGSFRYRKSANFFGMPVRKS